MGMRLPGRFKRDFFAPAAGEEIVSVKKQVR